MRDEKRKKNEKREGLEKPVIQKPGEKIEGQIVGNEKPEIKKNVPSPGKGFVDPIIAGDTSDD